MDGAISCVEGKDREESRGVEKSGVTRGRISRDGVESRGGQGVGEVSSNSSTTGIGESSPDSDSPSVVEVESSSQ